MSAVQQVEYNCEVREVFSGDDLIVFVDLGVEGLFKKQRIRLAGVDTPNSVGKEDSTEAGVIRREVRMLARHKKGRLTLIGRNTSSWIVELVVETATGPVNVNKMLIERGYQFKEKKADKVIA